MKEWYFYDASGTRRRVKQPYFYDAGGTRRTVKAGYFYEPDGTRRQFYQSGGGPGQVLYTGGQTVGLPTDPFVVPDGVTEVFVAAVGGGGGAGGVNNNPLCGGGGGGGLGWARIPVTPGQVLNLRPGARGLGSTTGTGGTGEASVVSGSSQTYVSAGGGLGSASGTGGAGGTAIITLPAVGAAYVGGSGGNGTVTSTGGGGGAGGYSGTGGTGGVGVNGVGVSGQGGAGGGGGATGGGGGGVRLDGEGASGAGGAFTLGGKGGSGGSDGDDQASSLPRYGGLYGGGGSGNINSTIGGAGRIGAIAVRWGSGAAYPTPRAWVPYEDDFTATPGGTTGDRRCGMSSTTVGISRGTMTPFFPAVKNGASIHMIGYQTGPEAGWEIWLGGIMSDPGSLAVISSTYLRGVQIDGIGDVLVSNAAGYTFNRNLGWLQVTEISTPGAWVIGTPYIGRCLY